MHAHADERVSVTTHQHKVDALACCNTKSIMEAKKPTGVPRSGKSLLAKKAVIVQMFAPPLDAAPEAPVLLREAGLGLICQVVTQSPVA